MKINLFITNKMKQFNNQNYIAPLNDMKETLSNNLNFQKNFILNLNNIIEFISSGINDLIPLFESIKKILPELISYLGIPFCDILNETNIINYYFNTYINTKEIEIKNIFISFIQVFNFLSTDKTLGDLLIQQFSNYNINFQEISNNKRKIKSPLEDIYDTLNTTYRNSSLESKTKIKKELSEKIKDLETKKSCPASAIQYLKEKIVSIDNNIRIIDMNNIKNANVFNSINNYINNFTTNNFFKMKNIYKNNIIINEEINKVKNIPLKDREFLYKDEELIDEENEYTEFKQYSYPFSQEKIDEIKRQYCGFLNSHGGRIYIGINDYRIVKGIYLDRKAYECIKNDLINYSKDFYPNCKIEKINVYFLPVKFMKTNKIIKNLYVIKIIVMPGEPYNLYSLNNKDGYISALRLPGQCINLTAEEIYSELMKRTNLFKQTNIINKNDDINKIEFEEFDEEINESLNENGKENQESDSEDKKNNKKVLYVVKITNIDKNLKIKDINKNFTGCGCALQKFPAIEGKSKGYGEIHFSKKTLAKHLIQKFNKNNLGGKSEISMKLIKRTLKEK